VQGHGGIYLVDAAGGSCSCPDSRYRRWPQRHTRPAERFCKHARYLRRTLLGDD